MHVVIAGGHGKIALLLAKLLAGSGHRVDSLIRNPEQADDIRSAGGVPVVIDLEKASAAEIAAVVEGSDAVVFAAGAGAGSGIARKDSVDRGTAVSLAEAAERTGVRRFVQISAMGVDDPPRPGTDEVWAAYLVAKAAAEHDLRTRDLDATILRPGLLTDDPATGSVLLAPSVPRAEIPRADVAAVIAELLAGPYAIGQTVELISGESQIPAAVRAL
jgi:uncharacterized protein YbjT (DUF2867 family)